MDTDPEIWTSLMWCNFLRPVESRVYEEAKDKTKVGCCDMMRFIWDWRIFWDVEGRNLG